MINVQCKTQGLTLENQSMLSEVQLDFAGDWVCLQSLRQGVPAT